MLVPTPKDSKEIYTESCNATDNCMLQTSGAIWVGTVGVVWDLKKKHSWLSGWSTTTQDQEVVVRLSSWVLTQPCWRGIVILSPSLRVMKHLGSLLSRTWLAVQQVYLCKSRVTGDKCMGVPRSNHYILAISTSLQDVQLGWETYIPGVDLHGFGVKLYQTVQDLGWHFHITQGM